MKSLFRAALATLVAVAATGAAYAHHSFAMFDRDKSMTLVGVVHEFQWTNPHSFIEVDVPNAEGKPERWSLELNSPNNLRRQGWKPTSIKPGDKVTFVIAPLRDGRKGGLFIRATLADGTVLGDPTSAGSFTIPAAPPGSGSK